jgi:hypothetical protein
MICLCLVYFKGANFASVDDRYRTRNRRAALQSRETDFAICEAAINRVIVPCGKTRGEKMNRKSIIGITFVAAVSLLAMLPAMASQAPSQAAAGSVNLTGRVSCSKFGAAVPHQKGFSQSEAINQCISQGFSYTLVVGKQVYPLSGDNKQLAKLAGATVTVAGRLNAPRPEESESVYNGTLEATSVTKSTN